MLSVTAMYSFVTIYILLFRPTYRPAQVGAVAWAGSLLGRTSLNRQMRLTLTQRRKK